VADISTALELRGKNTGRRWGEFDVTLTVRIGCTRVTNGTCVQLNTSAVVQQ